MRNYSKYILIGGLPVMVLASCKKMTNQYFGNGSTPTMSLSATTLAPTPADSSNNVLAISWTNPHYATDSASELYSIQIDSSGRNFAKAVTIAVSGALVDSLTAKQINTIALGFGFSYRVAYNMDIRVISSYANNNQQLFSNTKTINYTPYVIPPKVVPPTGALYLVGAASQGGWNAPVPVPTQVFEQVDSVDYAGVFQLNGGQQFLILPQNTGSYNNKLATNDNSETGTGGTFAYNDNNNFTGPSASGWYTIWVNFQTGSFTIAALTSPIDSVESVPDSLFIVGSATPGSWTSPVPEPSQVMTQISSSQFTITLPFEAAGQYLLLPTNGAGNNYMNKYAVGSNNNAANTGIFGFNPNGANSANFNNNFNGPTNAGTYTLTVDFLNTTYTLTQ
jgi:starch-binding outer membrane protein SusE/F